MAMTAAAMARKVTARTVRDSQLRAVPKGWQLIDELNRARAGQPPSGYVAPPYLVTQADVPNGPVFDPPSGYRENYLRIWRG